MKANILLQKATRIVDRISLYGTIDLSDLRREVCVLLVTRLVLFLGAATFIMALVLIIKGWLTRRIDIELNIVIVYLETRWVPTE